MRPTVRVGLSFMDAVGFAGLRSRLSLTQAIGDELARLRVALKAIGRVMKVMDAWIAATAMAHGAAICMQDADFEAAAEADLIEVVQV
jgi:predicted nucleic acid-binding protein